MSETIDLSANIAQAKRKSAEQAEREFQRLYKRSKAMKREAFQYAEAPTLNDHIMAKNCGEILERHYPGWEWAVGVGQGLVRIHAGKLDMQYGYVLHADKIDNDYQAVKRAGGEILERYRMPRNGFRVEKYLTNRRIGINPRGQSRFMFDGETVIGK